MNIFGCTSAVVAALLTPSCVLDWPKSSGKTYAGQVVHFSLGTPIPNATVVVSRPAARPLLWPMVSIQEIGRTTTDSEGRFHLSTRVGFAQDILVATKDHRLAGYYKPGKGNEDNLLIKASPHFSVVCRSGTQPEVHVDPESPSVKATTEAMESIINDVSSHPGQSPKSLIQYRDQHIISPTQFDVFVATPRFYFGPHSLVEFQWGEQSVLISDADRAIRIGKRPASTYFLPTI